LATRFTNFGWRNAGATCAIILLLAIGAAACTDMVDVRTQTPLPPAPAMYAAVTDDGFNVPAVPMGRIDPQYRRQVVATPGRIPGEPGTIVVDPQYRHLYFVQADGSSIRYGIGVGREGFAWSGEATIQNKKHWPKWYPPKEMVERDPRAAPYANGMAGGLDNPLGARALYLFQGKRDTLYRIHGTNDPSSIGKAVSSGCIRMIDQDVMDLYERAPIGTKVIVLQPDTGFPLADVFDQLFPPAPPQSPIPAQPIPAKKT
jgi:lipoprotein-anchoring transpeptidase ErfK/SrfK